MRYDPGGVFPFRPRGRSQGHAVLRSPARVDGQPLGAVRARSRPVVDQEHLTIDGQRNASHAVVVTSAAAPLGRVSKVGGSREMLPAWDEET
jgi:hypothetical protein